MPRKTRPVDYPQVHPPSIQPNVGLAPPQDVAGSRFSWQDQPVVSSKDKNAGNENRQSSVPPLPVLPDHLDSQQPIPVIEAHSQPIRQPAQYSTFPQPSQFRPDIPRIYQPQTSPQKPLQIPTYEASQALHQQAPTMQEQTMHPTQNHQQPQPQFPQPPIHQSSEIKPKPARQLEPDHNPLSTPISPTSPTTNIQSFPPFTHSTYSPPPTKHGGSWRYSLASCSEPTTCFSSLFCPCIIYGRTQHRLALKSARKDPTNMLGYSTVNGSCVAWSLLCGANIFLTAIQRTRIRKTYEMDATAGNVATDCLTSLCCCCCIIAQNEKEMKVREEREVVDQYTSPGAMTFSPQA